MFRTIILLVLMIFGSSSTFAQNITIVSPEQDSIVQGTIKVEAVLSDPSIVERVQFKWLEGDCRDIPPWSGCAIRSRGDIGEVTEAPYVVDFDTTVLENGKTYFIAVCVIEVSGAEQCEQVWGLVPDNPDITGPEVRYNNIQIVSDRFDYAWQGTVQLKANVSDESEIIFVDFYYDDYQFIGRVVEPLPENNAIFALDWDTTTVANGEHDIVIVASDVHGNETTLTPYRLGWGRYLVENRYAPQNLTGRAKGYHVNILWQGSGQEESYRVFRRLDTETDFVPVGDTDNTVWVDDMPVGTAFAEYFVIAVYAHGVSEPSDVVRIAPVFRSR